MRLDMLVVFGLLALAGCAPETVCARNSDCERGAYCSGGSCIHDCTPSTAEERCGPAARCSSLGQCVGSQDAGLADAPPADAPPADAPPADAPPADAPPADAPLATYDVSDFDAPSAVDAGLEVGVDAPSDTGNDAPGDAGLDSPDGTATGGPTLIFSEYVEGTSFNKAVEVRNIGVAAVDLGAWDCRVQIFHNGSVSPTRDIPLMGALDVGAVRVLCHTSATMSACESRGTLDFNGDDALALVCAGTSIDVLGQIGFRPDTAWGSVPTRTIDATLRRVCPATVADPLSADSFDPAAAWRGLDIDVFDGLGSPACAP